MQNRLGVILTCLVLGAPADIYAAQIPPVPEHPPWAQTPLGFNPKTRCPDLRMSDEGTAAVVVFWLSRSGVASQITVKSSGSQTLDSAAVGCVSKLRFAPATTLGTGDAVDSWQQVAFRWADQGRTDETHTPGAAPKGQDDSNGRANGVTVHVCADETGKLKGDPTIVHSSGVASVDQAAVKIASSGSAYYRPDTSSNGPPVSGCAQLTIKFDAK
jgi:TonB family protein